jgi:quercetin dioxygenase-like cupin family protein
MEDFIIQRQDCVQMQPFPGVTMWAFSGDHMTISLVQMEPHSVIEEHSHPHEQMGFMIEGEAEFIIAGKSYRVTAGQMWKLPGGVPHKVVALEQGVVAIDAFYPCREDMKRPNSWGTIGPE